jgi:hypothetical protein
MPIHAMDAGLRSDRELLMGELRQHLQHMNIDAKLLELDSLVAFRYPKHVLGCVKIEGRNIDLIQVQLLRLVNNHNSIPPKFGE